MRPGRTPSIFLFASFLVLLSVRPAVAQPAVTQPATQTAPVPAGGLKATITGIQGSAQVRDGEGLPWRPAQVGTVVDQGAEFRTGPRSALTFVIPPDQTCTIDRLTTIKLLQAVSDGRKLTTDLGMQYGRTMYEIEAAGLQHDSRIVSPGATMAVRGTRIVYEDHAPFTPSMVSNEGRVQYRNLRRQVVAFGGKQRARMSAADRAPAETARKETRVNPQGAFAAKDDAELEAIAATGSASGLDANAIDAIQGLLRTAGPGDVVGVPQVPGPLAFTLQWGVPQGGKKFAADLDLTVTDPKGQTASFSNPTIGTGSSVGQHSGNQKGEKGAGIEVVQWGLFFPAGKYEFTVRHQGGAPARTIVVVFRQSESLVEIGLNPKKPVVLRPGQTITQTVVVRDRTPSQGKGGQQKQAQRPVAREARPGRGR